MTDAGRVEVTHNGEIFRASYSVKNGMVHILTPLGAKPPRPLGGAPPRSVAGMMLKDLLHERDAKARGR